MALKATLALLVATMWVTSVQQAPAQAQVDGPAALIITYHARPGASAKFRSVMQTEGVPQFEKWRRDDVFASYQALFTTYAADTEPDMFVVLRFNHFSDLWRWQRIEEKSPGGLPEDAQLLAAADTSATADVVKESSVAATTSESQFFVLEYDVLVDMPKYTSQNPAGAPWSSFIVLEYKDLKSLAAREVIKNQARADLAVSNPAWKKWSDDKTAMRTEKAAIPVRALNVP